MAAALDLGTLDGPVLLFGGPYSNLQATLALKDAAARHGIPAERVICTGDMVAYCADPGPTVDLIRAWGCHVVLGNCEESLGAGSTDCGCGFAEGSPCDLLSQQWFAHASAQLSPGQKAWMADLPHALTFRLGGARIAVVHGHARDISEWVFASTPEEDKAAALDALGVDAVIAGHSGLPFSQVLADGRLWHNPGVIGVPANDGTSRVWYSLLEPVGDALILRHLALTYDHRTAIQRMAENGLPGAYAAALASGLWPSLDVLPRTEETATGKPLAPTEVLWTPPHRHVA